MADLALGIAASAIAAQQTAMDTVSENLANANTDGYVAQTAVLTAVPGAGGVGAGVRVTSVVQADSTLLQANAHQTQGALAQVNALQQVLLGAQAVFPEPTTHGLGGLLSSFWQAWDALAQNPTSLAPRTQVVDLAQNLATSFSQAAQQLSQLQNNVAAQLNTTVAAANTQLAQVAKLNVEIQTVAGSGTPGNALVDQRNAVVNDLARSIGAVSQTQPDGSVTLRVGGVTLVQGGFADTVKVAGIPGALSLVATSSGTTIAGTAGSTAGLLAAGNQYLPAYRSQLDDVANALASTVNNQLAAGFTASGASGAGYPMFTGAGATGLGVNAAVAGNPQLIAASDTSVLPDASNNGGNAQTMAELFNVSTGPDAVYQSLVEGLGAQVQSVNTQVDAQTSVARAAQQNLQAVTGVDINAQMVAMLSYQQVYEASAKLIGTVSRMVDALLGAV